MKKKLFSIIMCVLMIMCYMPTAAFADGTDAGSTDYGTIDIMAYDGTIVTLSDGEGLASNATNVKSTISDENYVAKYSGGTLYLKGYNIEVSKDATAVSDTDDTVALNAINGNSLKIKVEAASSIKLTNTADNGFVRAIYASYLALSGEEKLTIEVSHTPQNGANTTKSKTGVYGINAECGAKIEAPVDITVTGECKAYGIGAECGTISLTGGDKSIDVSNGGQGAFGVYNYAAEYLGITTGNGDINVDCNLNIAVDATKDGKGIFSYDGTTRVSSGTFNFDPTAYVDTDKGFSVSQDGDNWVVSDPVADVNGVKYGTLKAAIEAAATDQTIKLLDNVDTSEITENTKTFIIEDKNLTIDTNGFSITDSLAGYTIDVKSGALTIKGGGTINKTGNGITAIRALGALTLENVTVSISNYDSPIAVEADENGVGINGTLIVNDETVINATDGQAIQAWGVVTINGGTMNGRVTAWSVKDWNPGKITVAGGTINGNVETYQRYYVKDNVGSYPTDSASISVTNGKINGELVKRYVEVSGRDTVDKEEDGFTVDSTIAVSGGTFSSNPTAYVASGYAAVGNTDGTWTVKATSDKIKVDTSVDGTTKVTDKSVSGQTTETVTTADSTTTTVTTDPVVKDGATKTTETKLVVETKDGTEVKTKTETETSAKTEGAVTTNEQKVTTTTNNGDPVVVTTKSVKDTENNTAVNTRVEGTTAAATATVETPTSAKETLVVDATAAAASTESVKAVAVTLPKATVEVLKTAATGADESKKVEAVELKTDVATLEISNDALKTLTSATDEGSGDLVLSVAKTNDTVNPDSTEIRETVTFDLTATVDNKPVFSENSEKDNGTITIKVPYTEPKENEIVKVYYVADDNTKTEMNASYAGGFLTWDTNHFSRYLGETLVRGAKISGGTVTGNVGKKVTVDVDLTYNSGLGALTVGLGYDTTALKLISAKNGTALTGFMELPENFDTDTNLIWYPTDESGPINCSETGTLVTLTFELLKAGTYDVNFVVDGENTVALEVGQNDDIEVPVTIVKPATITATTYGDVDKSGDIKMNDVIFLARHIAKWPDYVAESTDTTDFAKATADLNSDDKVNLKDLLILEKHIAEWEGYDVLPYVKSSNKTA